MTLDINWLLEQRKVLNEQFIEIISKKDAMVNQEEDLAEFCSTMTDYLAASYIQLGISSNFEYAASFSDKYANGLQSEAELRRDLSGLILMLSEHWNKEDIVIKKLAATASA